jgi:hypothetical protein
VYENVLDVEFSAADDASLPPTSTASVTLRLNHRREGWNTFTFNLPSLADEVADLPVEVGPIQPPPQTVDITTPPRRVTGGRNR